MSDNDDERVNRLKLEEIKLGGKPKVPQVPFSNPVPRKENHWTSYSNVRTHADMR